MTNTAVTSTLSRRSLLAQFRRDWLDAERSTEPADRTAAEQGARALYEAAGLAPPKAIVWMHSPLAAVVAGRALTGQRGVNQLIGGAAGRPVDDIVAQLRAGGLVLPTVPGFAPMHPAGLILDRALTYTGPRLPASVNSLIGRACLDAIDEEIRRQIDILSDQNLLWATSNPATTGLGDRKQAVVRWAAAQALGSDIGAAEAGIAVHKNCGGWYALRELLLLSERPTEIHADDDGQLHNDNGPALVYRDGFCVPIRHGHWPLPAPQPNPWRRSAITVETPRKPFSMFSKKRWEKVNQIVLDWRRAAFSTEPVDEHAVEQMVRDTYAGAGLAKPPQILWFDSPLASALAQSALLAYGHHQIDWAVADIVPAMMGKRAVTAQFVQRLQWHLDAAMVSRNTSLPPARTSPSGVFRTATSKYLSSHSWDCAVFTDWPDIWARVRENVGSHLGTEIPETPCLNALGVLPEREADRQLLLTAALEAVGAGVQGAAAQQNVSIALGGWWWALNDVAVLTRPPVALHKDRDGLLHSEDGPAMQYGDGFSIYAWHNTLVPADLIEFGWNPERIMNEPNTEVRRCAIERLGWDAYIEQAGLTPYASAPDPGNHGHDLQLYDIPNRLISDVALRRRLLLCTNGSIERDGTRRRYGLLVPDRHKDPVAAAAELYGVPVEVYRDLEIRR